MARRSAWGAWVSFAGVMLLVAGAINIIQAIVALVDDQRVAMVAGRLYVVDLTGWGWTTLVLGLLLVAAGLGLLWGTMWGRITAIVVVSLHAIAQVLWLGAYPVWSLLMIALDTVVLFALTARWAEASTDLSTGEVSRPARPRDTVGDYQARAM